MDLVIRFWDSCLLGLDLSKQIQLSMDGPSVNLKVVNKISKEREDAGLSKLINVGSCNLHVVHGALKSATEATGWNLKSIMKSSFQVLKDSPTRREDYICITESTVFARPLPVFLWGEFFDRVTFLKVIGLLCFSVVFCLLHFSALLHCFTCLF